MAGQQQGDERPAARALPGALQGVHAATLRRRLLATSAPARTAARWPAAAKASARAAVVLQQAMRPGAAPGHVHRRGAAKGRLQRQQQGTRHLWIAQGSVARGIPVAGQRQQDPVADALLPQQGRPRHRAGGCGRRQQACRQSSPATGAQPCLPIRRQCVAAAPDADLAALGQGMRRQRCGQRPRAPRALQCIQPVLGGGGRPSWARSRGMAAAVREGVTGIGCGCHCTSRDSCRRVPSRPGRGREHARSTGARRQLRVQLTQQAGQRRTGCTGRLIDGGEAGASQCQLPSSAVPRSGSIQPGLRPSTQWGWRRPGQRGRASSTASAASNSRRTSSNGQSSKRMLARPDLRAQPAQRGEIQWRVRMAAGQVDQQRQQPQRARPGPTGTAGSRRPRGRTVPAVAGPAAGRASRWHGDAAGLQARLQALRASAKRAGSRRGSPRRHPAVPRRFPGRGSDGRHRTGSRARRR